MGPICPRSPPVQDSIAVFFRGTAARKMPMPTLLRRSTMSRPRLRATPQTTSTTECCLRKTVDMQMSTERTTKAAWRLRWVLIARDRTPARAAGGALPR